jgi:hypothetical protein
MRQGTDSLQLVRRRRWQEPVDRRDRQPRDSAKPFKACSMKVRAADDVDAAKGLSTVVIADHAVPRSVRILFDEGSRV